MAEWQEPRLSWKGYHTDTKEFDPTADGVGANDLNRIEGNTQYLKDNKADCVEGIPGTALKAVTMDGVRVQAYCSTSPALELSTVIPFDTIQVDPKSKYNNSTYRCTPGVGTFLVYVNVCSSGGNSVVNIRLNGSAIWKIGGGANTSGVASGSVLVTTTSITDYIDFATGGLWNGGTIVGGITGGIGTFFSLIQIA